MAPAPDAYEAFLNLPPMVLVVIITIPAVIIMWVSIRFSLRRGADSDFTDFANSALAVVGGAFIFVAAFAVVTSWETQSRLESSVTSEFTSVTSLAEDLGAIPSESSKTIALSLVDYATLVKETEIGAQGVVAANPEAQKALAVIEASVTQTAESPGLTDHQVDNLYNHMEAVKDARKDRISISVPNLPLSLNVMLALSAVLTLLGIGLYPASRIPWLKYFYGGATTLVTIALIVAVLILQSPVNVATESSQTIDMFIDSVSDGGANIGMNDGQQGTLPAPQPGQPGQQPGQAPGQQPLPAP
jgi:hypothetical protein